MTKSDAWFWIVLIVLGGVVLVVPSLRRRSDWVNWTIVLGGAVALVIVLIVFPPH